MTEATAHQHITEDQLFDRLVDLETQAAILAEDIAQLKKDATYHAKHNAGGIPKDEVSRIAKAAKLKAKAKFDETYAETLAVFAKYRELTDE